MLLLFYILAFFALLNGMGAIFTLVEKFPIKLLYYHYRFRKIVAWSLVVFTYGWLFVYDFENFSFHYIAPLFIISLATLLTYKVHQSNWFKYVNYPKLTSNSEEVLLSDNHELALIDFNGVRKAYSLNYVIHHHVVNDKFKDATIALTYCAMCRSIIPFNVTVIGPLFVASFKKANMIVADQKTSTFFQQATFNSIIGKLHPLSLEMVPFQVLSWREVKALKPFPEVTVVTQHDLRPFNMPMPGVWKKVMSSELTPGLSNKDTRFPSKTHVIGISEGSKSAVYLKNEVVTAGIVKNNEFNLTIISTGHSIVAFKNYIDKYQLDLLLKKEGIVIDKTTQTEWDLTGSFLTGTINQSLTIAHISEEYWFSWLNFHPNTELIRL